LLSFLRKQESPSPAVHWIPACAGMTGRGASSQTRLQTAAAVYEGHSLQEIASVEISWCIFFPTTLKVKAYETAVYFSLQYLRAKAYTVLRVK
jgi:hypothetical protein